jgi:hypothetical protein
MLERTRSVRTTRLIHSLLDTTENFSTGKLSAGQIKAGYAALKDIEQFIKTNKFGSGFIEANNTYYTRSTLTTRSLNNPINRSLF